MTKVATEGLTSAVGLPVRTIRTLGLSWPLVMGLAAFLTPVFVPGVLNDGDTYWHIAAGRWMFEHHRVPTGDPFSYSVPGAAWTAHEWCAELIFASIYRFCGWAGLVILVATAFGLVIAYITRFLCRRLEPIHALLFAALAMFMMLPHLLARPHVLAWLLTAFWVGTLLNANETGRSPPWWLLAVLVLWANLHASFILGWGLAVAIGADAVLSATRGQQWRVARGWLCFLAVAGACTLANPQGYGAILYSFEVMHLKSTLAVVEEWRPPDFQQPEALTLWLLAVLGLGFSGRSRLPLVRAVVVIGLLYMSLEHVRNVPLLGLVSVLVMAHPMGSQWREQRPAGANVEVLDRWFAAFSAPARSITIGLVCLLAGATASAAVHFKEPGPPERMTPRRALQALFATGAGSRILNSYHFGGYLIFRGIPVFIDGRSDMYGDAFVDQYVKALTLTGTEPVLERLLERYRIDSTLLTPDTPALHLLDHSRGWHRVYGDKTAVVYIHTPADQDTARRPSG